MFALASVALLSGQHHTQAVNPDGVKGGNQESEQNHETHETHENGQSRSQIPTTGGHG
jgi:hypothetical protein